MVLSASVVGIAAFVAINGGQDEFGFEDLQIASEELLEVWHLVEDHPCVVEGADIFWHKGF